MLAANSGWDCHAARANWKSPDTASRNFWETFEHSAQAFRKTPERSTPEARSKLPFDTTRVAVATRDACHAGPQELQLSVASVAAFVDRGFARKRSTSSL